ncbi:hypothetical protein BM533_21915, partial [Clostridioides difficile]
ASGYPFAPLTSFFNFDIFSINEICQSTKILIEVHFLLLQELSETLHAAIPKVMFPMLQE